MSPNVWITPNGPAVPNPSNWRANQALGLITPDRGVSFGFEDKRPLQWGNDRDFNDVIVTLTPRGADRAA